MLRHFLLATVGLIAATALISCASQGTVATQTRTEYAKQEAEKFFAIFPVRSMETRRVWDMTDYSVFGRETVLGWGIAAGSTEVKKVADSPETYEVMIPFWVEGKRHEEAIKLSRRLYLLLRASEGEWWVYDYELDIGEKSIEKQGWTF